MKRWKTATCVWCRQDGCTPENEDDCPCPHHAYFGRQPWRHWTPEMAGSGTHWAECTTCGAEITRWRPADPNTIPTKHRRLIDDHTVGHLPVPEDPRTDLGRPLG